MTGSHAQLRPEVVKTDNPPHKPNTFNRQYETDSESETEELYTPRHFTMGSIELHEYYYTTTDDEHAYLDTSLEDEHVPMDYQCTTMPTPSPPCNMEYTIKPPTPHPRRSRTHPILLPRPSKVNTVTQSTKNHCKSPNINAKKSTSPDMPTTKKYATFNDTIHTSQKTKQENSFQDHHHGTTIDTNTNTTFQDHRVQTNTFSAQHYRGKSPQGQDPIHTYKDSSHCKCRYTCQC